MNNDLLNAKNHLMSGSYTCVLCREEQRYTSRYRGVKPLLDFLDSGEDFSNFSAADKVVGKATAFLYCLLGVRALYAQVISQAAVSVLFEHGIPCSYDRLVPAIRNRENTGPCPLEHATRDLCEPQTALDAIRRTLEQLRQDPPA